MTTPKKPAHKRRALKEPKTTPERIEDKEILKCYRQVAKTAAGRKMLRHLMEDLGYKLPCTVREARTTDKGVTYGDVLPILSAHNEARRGVWLDIRSRLPVEELNQIESEELNDVGR